MSARTAAAVPELSRLDLKDGRHLAGRFLFGRIKFYFSTVKSPPKVERNSIHDFAAISLSCAAAEHDPRACVDVT
jgi:hypothetical protein